MKIDQSFIRDITTDANDAAIVATIIAMARNLDIDVIAEGVEHPQELNYLQEYGCNLYQGYHFYRPMAAKEMGKLIPDKNVAQVQEILIDSGPMWRAFD